MSQQDQWQQPHVPAPKQQQQLLSDPMDMQSQQQQPLPQGYPPFGPSLWAVPPTPGGQPSPWQPPPPPQHQPQQQRQQWAAGQAGHSPQLQQNTFDRQSAELQQQQRPGRQPQQQGSAGHSTPGGQSAPPAAEPSSVPPLVQDWSWLSSLPQ